MDVFGMICKEIVYLEELAFENIGIAERAMELQKKKSAMLYYAGRAHAYLEYMHHMQQLINKFNMKDK